MDERDREASAGPGKAPTYLRLDDFGSPVLLEVDAEGQAVREVLLASDGRPRESREGPAVTDYVYDYAIPKLWPGTPEFEAAFRGKWESITRAEFETAYEQARLHPLGFRALPGADQRRQVGACLLVVAVLAVVLLLVAVLAAVALAAIRSALTLLFGIV